MRVAVLLALLTLSATAAASDSPFEPPISKADTAEIKRVLGAVTRKPILLIMAATREKPFAGAVIRYEYLLNVETGKQTPVPQYLRRDLVYVYMHYTDRSHVDVYTVRKVRGRWKVEEKKDWFI
ncbi:MAG: hypothetical protein DME97_13230 [Verrucomicrobia bacterium]|nr:MAG: hypothetical protein DME97_13230 [Verrucomicrobiota bacterium]